MSLSRYVLLVFLALLVVFLWTSGAIPSSALCDSPSVIGSWLGLAFGESPAVVLDFSDGVRFVVVFANLETGTWTLVVQDVGRWCVVGAGSGVTFVAPPVAGVPG